MGTPRTRLTVNTSLDRELVERLRAWCRTQTAEVPLGRALDACMRDFLDRQVTTAPAVQIHKPDREGA